MRITWGITVLALAVVVTAAHRTTPVHAAGAQAAGPAITVEQFPALMKTIGSTQATLRMKMMNNALPDAAKDAQAIAATFGDVEKFFTSKNKSDAVMWAQQGKAAATAVATALSAGDAMKATTELGTMAASCKQCHGVYRDGGPQTGGYKFKEGTI